MMMSNKNAKDNTKTKRSGEERRGEEAVIVDPSSVWTSPNQFHGDWAGLKFLSETVTICFWIIIISFWHFEAIRHLLCWFILTTNLRAHNPSWAWWFDYDMMMRFCLFLSFILSWKQNMLRNIFYSFIFSEWVPWLNTFESVFLVEWLNNNSRVRFYSLKPLMN